ncbi:MAG: exodeoxyribonuclease VII large subunit [Flavobacteriales bacterium]
MPELFQDRKIFSLLEVANSIQRTISERYGSAYWIRAEINKISYYSHSGHAYPELVEKVDGKVVAEMRATIWSAQYTQINANFEKVLGEPLKDGIKVLLLASIRFDPRYGMSLHIQDIDPAYTLGDLEKEKQEAIHRLKSENLFDRNKSRELSILPNRIAIISVETSKGYADFLHVLNGNPYGYVFFHMLFPALLQGENAISSIIEQLNRIKLVIGHFDAVVIVRGGGGDVGLSCYNNYVLAKEIACFPIPVLTGIGHATNETVSELVAFQNAITPTKLAEFLLQRLHLFAVPVSEAAQIIPATARKMLLEENHKLQSEARLFKSTVNALLNEDKNRMERYAISLKQHSILYLRNEKSAIAQLADLASRSSRESLSTSAHNVSFQRIKLAFASSQFVQQSQNKLAGTEREIHHLHPENVLKRGYSITLHKNKAVTSVSEIKEGDVLITQYHRGQTSSIVKSKKEES